MWRHGSAVQLAKPVSFLRHSTHGLVLGVSAALISLSCCGVVHTDIFVLNE